MAMAAVRLAARRLAGQQPQAILRSAVANEQGLLLNRGGSPAHALRRFTSSEACAAKEQGLPVAKVSAQHPSLTKDSRLMAADRKKEELADLLHEIQMNKEIPRARRNKDRWLLQRLTDHVDPRPNNPEWSSYIQGRKLNNWLRSGGTFLAFLFMVEQWYALGQYLFQGADSDSKTNASCVD